MKKGIAFEQLVPILIGMIVLVVVITVFYLLTKPSVTNIGTIGEETSKGGGTALDALFKMFGRKCDDGKICCNAISGTIKTCKEGVWETGETPCEESMAIC